ncbi:MAG: TIGR04255 family protein [Candidatus Cloacimonetes bacterium]|nr:TIGR04255 family protein [Candidatus Cloacimonadota bacterium]
MSKKYKKPPIIEALCEFQFIPSKPWDMTIPGLMYARIHNEFPIKQQQRGFGVSIQSKKEGKEPNLKILQRMQFFSSNKNALVQIGPDLLTINHLKNYPSWKIFKPLILNNLKIYQEISQSKGFKRIGLRYINKINFSKASIELSDYFSYYPIIPHKLPQTHEAFNIRVEIPYENKRDRLLLKLANTISEKPDFISLLLDLDYIMTIKDSITINEASNWIENAHNVIENAFEACITDKCRNIFQEVK